MKKILILLVLITVASVIASVITEARTRESKQVCDDLLRTLFDTQDRMGKDCSDRFNRIGRALRARRLPKLSNDSWLQFKRACYATHEFAKIIREFDDTYMSLCN
ncbi:MAG: hypothetical protein A2750_04170 [Candidatus Yanofskybacteria bacterium RIFCSPHIGHO2_01_FULL_45_42]|uniref:Uncharacterized protein n=3 Tax=Candidatus Yanofskyibacteriota TaxID=1752733 RepID=A0A1F8H4B5_9BACT|nr:MAG: hypothetical protein A2750_04170 [Candidatus Yanofskybacteria bacterium RIFCSPHIGHO2_01_FULL_45_42]OGN15420.1 MAG: hypothetical protein A3C81_01645 [Candidatus Yanofskybacteria bacterium RIFCSPHIGHO2_02_FULL_46_19]OGN28334.1 MAG: hypothetical protein A3B17_02900 [Candidatus Yanofskybacteria bacterium RIFCSPLOWO2_01_FULL_45_72]OGN32442.1 MAG: hypothetical protein A3J01_00025 [Candidatus Yanofskybacteria bacterium RIFCSPLOWO2_02_FULL_45_18]